MSMLPHNSFHSSRRAPIYPYRHPVWPPARFPMREFEHLFDSFINNHSSLRHRDNAGHLKLSDDGHSFEYSLNVAGYRPEELKVDLEEDSGEHKEERVGESIHRHFKRHLRIPEGIDRETIKCDLDDAGMLFLQGAKKLISPSRKRPISIESKPTDKGGRKSSKSNK